MADANNCTVELVTGSRIGLAHSVGEMQAWLVTGEPRRFKRMEQRGVQWAEVVLQAPQVAAIYPLDDGPDSVHIALLDQVRAMRDAGVLLS